MSKHYVIISLLIFFSYYDVSVAVDSPCGDWEPYKEEKCIKIFDKAGLQSYENAEKTCLKQENGASLITIRYKEEQEFISNLFKTHKVANDIWIEIKYDNNKYKLNDDSELVFANWAQGSPKNKSDHCVQMNSDETLFSKWSDVLCSKVNIVACQKMQTWSLSHLQKVLLNTIKNPFPIGFIYTQLPNENSPMEIWPWMIWNDVSSTYAGVFLRITGGEAANFGEVQGDNAPHLNRVEYLHDCQNTEAVSLKAGDWSDPVITGIFGGGGYHNCHKYLMTGGEVRPRNIAIRLWKRTG